MNLVKNMQFEIKNGFMPNLSSSETLTILEVTPNSVVIQMNKSNGRGVFPAENFQYWIRRGVPIEMNDQQKRTSLIKMTVKNPIGFDPSDFFKLV